MTEIRTDSQCITLINVFNVSPEKQQELVNVLVRATREVMRYKPGYISANIHKSLDGTRVTNYAQWRTKEDFDSMLLAADVLPHMKKALDIAKEWKVDGHLYQVIFTDQTEGQVKIKEAQIALDG